ncbi:MAG: ornithine carbamoyltransferase [Rhodospirillaceae bacterium]|jgi:ornithine carbamoyltransferase|nr:ornithine carbamoyltransferase [Rhodospirillaceae bacterium]
MSNSMKGMSLVTLEEFSSEQIEAIVAQSIELKRKKQQRIFPRALVNRNFCLIFLRPSCRTRAAFAVAAADEGANAQVIAKEEIRFGQGESVKDIARVLGRMFDGIAIRAYDNHLIEEVAEHAGVPVWNALSEQHHPTQALADLMTLQENGIRLCGGKMTFIGEGKANVITSLMVAAAKVGLELRIVTPPGHEPEPSLVDRLLGWSPRNQARILVTNDLREGLQGTDAVYSDMWVPMEGDWDIEAMARDFQPYRLTREAMAMTENPNAIFLHCMPAQHNFETAFARKFPSTIEVTDEVFEGPRSRAIDQAENRLHTIKSVMVATV